MSILILLFLLALAFLEAASIYWAYFGSRRNLAIAAGASFLLGMLMVGTVYGISNETAIGGGICGLGLAFFAVITGFSVRFAREKGARRLQDFKAGPPAHSRSGPSAQGIIDPPPDNSRGRNPGA